MSTMTVMSVALELALVAAWSTPSSKLTQTKGQFENKTSIQGELSTLKKKVDALKATATYHANTLFLFVYSDLKTVTLPWAFFGVAHALSAALFHIQTQSNISVLARTPLAILWVVLNLLPFTIGNQRQTQAIEEDRINKSWRPLPSGRLTQQQALKVEIAGYFFAFMMSASFLGGARQSMALLVLGYIYSEMGAGDNSFVLRNLINGLGFVSFGSGAMEVALGAKLPITFTPELTSWLALIVLIVTMGAHTADMYDQEGDRAVGRSTVPLIIGDLPARWTIVLSTLVSSFVCPWFWSVGPISYLLVLAQGLNVCHRSLTKREVEQDRKTFKMWNLWLLVVYCLPLMKTLGL